VSKIEKCELVNFFIHPLCPPKGFQLYNKVFSRVKMILWGYELEQEGRTFIITKLEHKKNIL
jgi:hypothetical protein